MKSIQAILASSLVAALAACGGSTPPAPAPLTPAADTSAPTVVSVSPADGSSGVLSDADIVITFSEPMNKLAAQSAYQSADSGIRPSQVVFTWNADGTVLTVNPNGSLGYNGGSDPASVSARQFAYQLTNVATDLAGNALPPAGYGFKTLRRIVQELPGLAALTGNVRADGSSAAGITVGDSGTAANAQYKGFVSFDLSGIPAGLHSFEEATLSMNQTGVNGSPYPSLGAVQLEHLSFAARDLAAFNAPALHGHGTLSNSAAAGFKTADVLGSVQDDYAQRVARGNRTQYRLAFGTVSNFNGVFDAANFANFVGGTPSYLTVRYLLP